VTLSFTAAGVYKLLTPLTLRGISLKMQLVDRLITNPQQVSVESKHQISLFFSHLCTSY
jgi:hypothetical protein